MKDVIRNKEKCRSKDVFCSFRAWGKVEQCKDVCVSMCTCVSEELKGGKETAYKLRLQVLHTYEEHSSVLNGEKKVPLKGKKSSESASRPGKALI